MRDDLASAKSFERAAFKGARAAIATPASAVVSAAVPWRPILGPGVQRDPPTLPPETPPPPTTPRVMSRVQLTIGCAIAFPPRRTPPVFRASIEDGDSTQVNTELRPGECAWAVRSPTALKLERAARREMGREASSAAGTEQGSERGGASERGAGWIQ